MVRARLVEANPLFLIVDEITPAPWGAFGGEGEITSSPFRSAVSNFYMTDPISRASATMAECSGLSSGALKEKTGTDG